MGRNLAIPKGFSHGWAPSRANGNAKAGGASRFLSCKPWLPISCLPIKKLLLPTCPVTLLYLNSPYITS